jgi:class 3 adenylate cyclase/YHS domain-containing protein
MEQEIAILIADLSGYTALTETHGATSAADLIDTYIEIVTNSLVGNAFLHQSVGDEVLITSHSPDHLFSTALMLLQNASRQPNFLQVHGALHYGKVVRRNNNYFGSAINLTARMGSHASANTFLCSEEFLNAVPGNSHEVVSKGKCNFKNVSEEKEVFEIKIDKPAELYIDPICRMIINKENSFIAHPIESNIFFCSQNCLEVYLKKNAVTPQQE